MTLSIPVSSLYDRDRLLEIHGSFLEFIKEKNLDLWEHYQRPSLSEESALIIELAPFLEEFLQSLFGINDKKEKASQHAQRAHLKRNFVQRYALRLYPDISFSEAEQSIHTLEKELGSLTEQIFCDHLLCWLEEKDRHPELIEHAAKYAAWRVFHDPSLLFSRPEKRDPETLLPRLERKDHTLMAPSSLWRVRHGFDLTDPGLSSEEALDQAHYCLVCHPQKKDSCRRGLKNRFTGSVEKTPQGQELGGCPLDQKISEMSFLKREGFSIAALAVIMIDNPMVAATGHRICNDCSKSCIFQKQDPVQVPGLETRILQDVLDLPFGWEIYSLLSRWNPLHFERPLPKAPTGYKVLVVGLGPAGFTLAHHLLNEGHEVIAIDGMKIEPLPSFLKGKEQPLDSRGLFPKLSERKSQGFGGVCEYGITVRWNKNYLTLLRPLLERRETFSLFGGVRLGSTLSLEEAFHLGFDHIALCLGAGKPKTLALPSTEHPNNPLFPRGVRQASDFLMALHSGGAGQEENLSSLQIQLPLVVIGGGLTAIDAATESLAYYAHQVETFSERYESLSEKLGKEEMEKDWTEEEKELAQTFLAHGKKLRTLAPTERLPQLKAWGGVTLVYHGPLEKAASYRLNAEEIQKALEEGVKFLEEEEPEAYVLHKNRLTGLQVKNKESGGQRILPAQTILMAVGTHHRHDLIPSLPEDPTSPFLPHSDFQGKVTFFGDSHPTFSGSVVKAMASAKKGYPFITQALEKEPAKREIFSSFLKTLEEEWKVSLLHCEVVSPKTTQLTFQAKGAARSYKPRQLFRLQPFSSEGGKESDPIPMTPLQVDAEKGLLTFRLHECGASTALASEAARAGKSLFLMGPVGQPSSLPEKERILCLSEEKAFPRVNLLLSQLQKRGNDLLVITSDLSHLHPPLVIPAQAGTQKETPKPHEDTLKGVTYIWAVGSASFLKNLSKKISDMKGSIFPKKIETRAGAPAPLQCMMQGVCGQCLHLIKDETGIPSFVFSCQEPDQPLEAVDWETLSQRLSQNSLLEKMSYLYHRH